MSTTRPVRLAFAAAVLAGGIAAPPAHAQSVRVLDRADYLERVRGLWLAECIANWTGLQTEGRRIFPPFMTDADWGTTPAGYPPGFILGFVTWGNPWGADDDTDIEYVYLHLHTLHEAQRLTPDQIRDGWIAHINSYIWVSNVASRELMSRGVRPPATVLAQNLAHGMTWSLDYSLMIDAQLTTELFGALCPGMPERALAMADLPIRTTAHGHAALASQAYVIMYSLALTAPRDLHGADLTLWLHRESRKFIPDGSKAADIMDFVLADYLANPDHDNWERTRDLCYERYIALGPANPGFLYRDWYESSINFATGLTALLYGEGDYRKTVRIGTLSGWDSDNGTATMGGLIGLLVGEAGIRAQFAEPLSSNFWISRTRDNMPDFVPGQPWEDTFDMMALRMRDIADREVLDAGGRVALTAAAGLPWFGADGGYLLPPGGAGDGLLPADARAANPLLRLTQRSANNRVRAEGGLVSAACSVSCFPDPAWYGSPNIALIGNGFEHDFAGLEELGGRRGMFSTLGCGFAPGTPISLSVTYDRDVAVDRVRFIEGDHFLDTPHKGGWFESLSLELRIAGVWTPAEFTLSEPLDVARPFQIIDFVLPATTSASGIRISGPASASNGATQAFVTCLELDAFAPEPLPPAAVTYDLNADGLIDPEDLFAWVAAPTDLNADGTADVQDAELLRDAVRWGEPGSMGR